MSMFSSLSTKTLVKAALLKDTPVYIQFYITARCNLTCKQCNIRYANSDVRECTLEEIKRIAENFAKMGVAMVLLTGGEPYTRHDLPEIIYEFESRGVHVRMQTNGLASEEAIQRSVEMGGHDISISLDSLEPSTQDEINGGFPATWHRALRAMSYYTKYLPKKGSFASLGCVIQRKNLNDIEGVIQFGTEVGWFTSLVPIHIAEKFHPMSFRSYDKSLRFKEEEFPAIDTVIERVREMRNEGYLLYDSDQYLDDIKRFVRNSNNTVTWRSKNNNTCDSPNLYFAVLPNGDFAPCCDHRMSYGIHTYDKNFPETYRDKLFRAEVFKITHLCPGCMYGSYPEITISLRFMAASLQRMKTFITHPPEKPWPLTYEQMLEKAQKIYSKQKK
jgi:MoaA/NifB/PqqE/SkfB family radical SAM enzyme